jgi:hypothetical protein
MEPHLTLKTSLLKDQEEDGIIFQGIINVNLQIHWSRCHLTDPMLDICQLLLKVLGILFDSVRAVFHFSHTNYKIFDLPPERRSL